jgi:phage terminase large subunit-like protein
MGCDLAQGDDFCAFTFLFPLGDGRFGVKTRSYITTLTQSKLTLATRLLYDEFINEGTLVIMDSTVLDLMVVYEDLEKFIDDNRYNVEAVGYDPYNAKEFIERWARDNGPYAIEKVIQGMKTESVPLGELKKLAEKRMLVFDEQLMKFAMGNSIVIEDNNGNRKLHKKRHQDKIDNVAAMMDAFIAYKNNKDYFE